MTVQLELLLRTFIKTEFAMKGCYHAELVSESLTVVPFTFAHPWNISNVFSIY